MKILMQCEPHEAAELAALMVREIPTFERSCRGVGWGWHYTLKDDGRTFFVRQLKNGLSAVPCATPNQEPEAGEGKDG